MGNFNSEKKHHIIYKTTNLLSGRYYIGMHSTNNLDDGYMGSGDLIRKSIKKHGKENHKFEILERCDSREELASREEELVNLQEIAKKDCMNLKVGGSGGLDGLTEQQINKIRKDPYYRKKISQISSKTLKRLHSEGKIKYNTFIGKKHSEETKKKISESAKGRGKGSYNSQFGTCWITNEKENKKIKKGDLIPEGWRLGRKMII
jgi:hypothetical protein